MNSIVPIPGPWLFIEDIKSIFNPFSTKFTLRELMNIRNKTRKYEHIMYFKNCYNDLDLGLFDFDEPKYNSSCIFCQSKYNLYPQPTNYLDSKYMSKFTEKEIANIKNNTKGYVHCLNWRYCITKKFFSHILDDWST